MCIKGRILCAIFSLLDVNLIKTGAECNLPICSEDAPCDLAAPGGGTAGVGRVETDSIPVTSTAPTSSTSSYK